MSWKTRIAAALLATAGVWCQLRIAASARSNVFVEKGLLLHFTAPAIVVTVLLVGVLAILLSAAGLLSPPRAGYPVFLLVALVGSAACFAAGTMASNWRVFTDAYSNPLLPSDHLHPVVALAAYPQFFYPVLGVELALWVVAIIVGTRSQRQHGG